VTFGEGITNLYLRPYNEKIWKYDPSLMDTQMVERIPKPPPEDIIKSAQGVSTEGYLHQLYFYYPKRGGVQSLLDGFLNGLNGKSKIQTGVRLKQVKRDGEGFQIEFSNGATKIFDKLVSTIPIPELIAALEPAAPENVRVAAQNLKYNSIAICLLHVKADGLGDNFAVMVPDKKILFHRLSKLDFLLPEESRDGTTRIMAEVTYRAGDWISQLNDREMLNRATDDLVRLGFIAGRDAVMADDIIRQKYAYVIYDLDHRRHMKIIRDFCEGGLGIRLHGRFGEFEYINMDAVIEKSMKQSQALLAK